MAHRYEPFDWYETPLYYDIVFDVDTEKECDFLEAMAAYYAPPKTSGSGAGGARGDAPRHRPRFLEPACGSGRLLAELTRRGYHASGFDLSEGMVRFTRDRLANVKSQPGVARPTVKRAPMQDFKYRAPFDVAFCFVSTFKYLLTEEDAAAHLRCVADALKPGGVYVLGFHLSEYDQTEIDRERWFGHRDGVKVGCYIQGWPPDPRTRLEKVRSRLVVTRSKDDVKRYESTWDFRTYDARQFKSLLRKAPDLEHIATYDFEYDPLRMIDFGGDQLDQIVILRKKR